MGIERMLKEITTATTAELINNKAYTITDAGKNVKEVHSGITHKLR